MREFLLIFIFWMPLIFCNPSAWAIKGGIGYSGSDLHLRSIVGFKVVRNGQDASKCTGTFINSHSILTANHCIPKELSVNNGNFIVEQQPNVDLKVFFKIGSRTKEIFVPNNRLTFTRPLEFIFSRRLLLMDLNDHMLIHIDSNYLKASVQKENISFKPIPFRSGHTFSATNEYLFFGTSKPPKRNFQFSYTEINYVKEWLEKGYRFYEFHVPDGTRVCQGDSGGPLFFKGSKGLQLVGSISTGIREKTEDHCTSDSIFFIPTDRIQ